MRARASGRCQWLVGAWSTLATVFGSVDAPGWLACLLCSVLLCACARDPLGSRLYIDGCLREQVGSSKAGDSPLLYCKHLQGALPGACQLIGAAGSNTLLPSAMRFAVAFACSRYSGSQRSRHVACVADLGRMLVATSSRTVRREKQCA